MKILITGATGAIGKDLVRYFSKKGVPLIAQGSSETTIKNLRKDLAEENIQMDSFSFWIQDFLEDDWIFPDSKDIKAIIHCAAKTKVREGALINYDSYFGVNVEGTKKMAKWALVKKIDHFISFSTGQIFGRPRKFPITEKTLKNPINLYGYTKLMSEQVVKSLGLFGLNYTIVRPFSVYGIGHHNIISIIRNKVVNDEELIIFGDGSQTRAFMHVQDICRAIDLVLNNEDCYGEEYNLSGPREYSINYLVDLLSKKFKKTPNIIYKQANVNELLRNIADTSKIKNVGFEYTQNLEDYVSHELH